MDGSNSDVSQHKKSGSPNKTALGFGSLDELFEMLVLLQTKFLGKVGTVFFWSISMQL